MRKSIIAIICFALSFCLVVPAFAEETDYSYLEDMSIKELKELRAAIDKLLPPEEGTSSTGQEVDTGYPEEDENGFKIDAEEEHYKMALLACKDFHSKMNDMDSFKLLEVSFVDRSETQYSDYGIVLEVQGDNKFGGTIRNYAIYLFNLDGTLDVAMAGEGYDISEGNVEKIKSYTTEVKYLNLEFLQENS